MRLGIVNEETWGFLKEIHEDLSSHHQVSQFQRHAFNAPVLHERINHHLFMHDLEVFLRNNDVVFFEWASGALAQATTLPKRCGIVTRLHRYEMYELVKRIHWDVVDKVILVSEAKRQEFIRLFPEQTDKAVVVYEAVDPNKFQLRNGHFKGNIGTLCDLSPRKRVYELILAFYELRRLNRNVHLHIGGGPTKSDSDYYYAIQDLVRQLDLQDSVTFHGKITEPWNWYQGIDIFVSNAYSEGLQVAAIEAMACGCYCLAHRWAGADELLPDSYLYHTDRQWIERIMHYCDAPESVKREQQAFMRSVVCEKFNIHCTKVQVREIIESVRIA